MQVVYTPRHLAHDIDTETFMGVGVPANEVAERAEIIRAALEADGGFELRRADRPRRGADHGGPRPGPASGSSRSPGPRSARQAIPTAVPVGRHVPEPRDVRGHEPMTRVDGSRARAASTSAAGPASGVSIRRRRSSPGTYDAARGRGRRRADDRGPRARREPAAYGLCRPPGHHAARSMYGGYCFFNNAAIAAHAITAATGERVAILDVDYHHGNGTQQIFWRRGDVRYVSIHADPERAYPYFLGRADETGEGEGAGENLNLPLRGRCDQRRLPRRHRPGRRGDRWRSRDRSSSCPSASTPTGSTPSATSR